MVVGKKYGKHFSFFWWNQGTSNTDITNKNTKNLMSLLFKEVFVLEKAHHIGKTFST